MQINTNTTRNFQEKTVPDDCRLVGWSALVRALEVQAPVRRPSAVSIRHVRGSRREEGDWIVELVEMPDRMAEDLLLFIRKNNGKLAKKHREDPFAKLTDEEVRAIEAVVQQAFEGFPFA